MAVIVDELESEIANLDRGRSLRKYYPGQVQTVFSQHQPKMSGHPHSHINT